MHRRTKAELEDWQVELYEAAETNLQYYRNTLEYAAAGGRIVEDDVGDITDQECQAVYWIATYKAWIAKFQLDHANDNNVATDPELADLISGDW
ncbi:hypothetical protein NFO65_18485 [Neorhizobium galegae]|uniref:hypothetical protein n=1 Tax=Neorhizobium galegae TaxID=399 RepID=UPI002101125C|nr:hypothetical protein [Neorhizobium galegae]MCQ1572720.1 hypothetical protein [Neorhizobium galegae]